MHTIKIYNKAKDTEMGHLQSGDKIIGTISKYFEGNYGLKKFFEHKSHTFAQNLEQVMISKRLFSLLVFVIGLVSFSSSSFAQNEEKSPAQPAEMAAPAHEEKKGINITELVFDHVSDSHEWHLFSLKNADGSHRPVAMPLPMIIYRPGTGLSVFSSSHFEEWHEGAEGTKISNEHEGVYIEKRMKEKVLAKDGSKVYDLSITKNVLSMLIGVVLLLWIMTSAAKKYKTGGMKAPKGMQNFIEIVVIFIRDEVAKPNLGTAKYKKFVPLLLTIFFFIWINNLLGLLPGGANFTGNIAVTACLALVSFIVMLVNANKHFWSHLLNPPNVPFLVKCLLVLIEVMSLFIKPVALMIRLFANMLAGHIVILSVVCLIFIFALLNVYVGGGFVVVSMAFSVFMFMLELLVAAIQAFIFTNLTAVFLGQAIEEAHHEEGHGAEAHH
ncbi:MAG: atpB [Flavipsychrobacter sp.]|nr:atpB [Flavipsychrobacter sp.]